MSASYVSLNSNPEQASDKVKDLTERGYSEGASKKVKYRGKNWQKTTYEKKSEGVERVMRGVGGVAATLGFVGLPLLSKEFVKATVVPAFEGSVKETVFVEQTVDTKKLGYDPADKEATKAKIGYDPTDSKSIVDFFKKPDTNYTKMGDYFVYFPPLKHTDGFSTFLLVDRDFKKGRSIEFHDREKGKPITNTAKQYRAAQTYCASIADIKTKWREELPKLAEQMVTLKTNLTKEDAIKAIKSRPKIISISAQDGNARIFGQFGPEFNPDNFLKGTLLKLEDDTKEEIKRVHGKSMKHKEPLQGEKPYRKPAVPPTPEQGPYTNHPGNSSAIDPEFAQFMRDNPLVSESESD